MRHFEDFIVGEIFDCPPYLMTREEMIAFASEYDAQPFHLDEDAAKGTFFDGLVASGWHTACVVMRLVAERMLLDSSGLGAPGIEELKWLRPVRAGDALSVRIEVIDRKKSRSKPDIGLVRFSITTSNQRGEPVMSQNNWIIFGRRSVAA